MKGNRLMDYFRVWDFKIVNRLPARLVFLVLLRVYEEYLREYNHGMTEGSLERAVNDWGKKAYPEKGGNRP